jgi:CheY-like chemotaxis protein
VILKEVLVLLRSSIPSNIEIHQDLDCDAMIMGNPTQVHQIVMNLCMNAVHAMENDGGALDISLSERRVDCSDKGRADGLPEGDYIELTVSDTGVGIPPDILESIFDPYFTTKEPGEGTGMGLAMVKGIIEDYGGEIVVESVLGKGTTFTISVPVTKELETTHENENKQLPKGSEHILMIDDEVVIADVVQQLLGSLGYTVRTSSDSIEALELFKSAPNDFDLVITDMTMPNMTGDKLAAELLKINPGIPVILFTGFHKRISADTAAEIGIRAFANKPVAKEDLAKIVRKVLDGADSRDQGAS